MRFVPPLLLHNSQLTALPDALPALYPRHCSSYTLKGFSILMSIRCHVDLEDPTPYYIATAVAELGPPPSLADEFNVTLKDEFLEKYGNYDMLEALEALWEAVKELMEEKTEGM
jgi:hypothetical protein